MRYGTKASGAVLGLLVLVTTTPAATEEDIKQAVDRGVTFLKGVQRENGAWPHNDRDSQSEVGATALGGMTLLDCGVPANDPAVERAAATVRQASITLTHTYSLSLAIMFLDRLGDPNDELLLQSMAVRLLGGQNEQGGWTYHCPSLNENEQRQLSNLRPQRSELVGRRDHPKPARPDVKANQELPKEIKDQLARLSNFQALGGDRHLADNSNTQFAALGLWVARRHGIPAERAMVRLAGRFRMSQASDGSWSYTSATSPGRAGSGTPSMTCAGLLALAVAHGTASQSVLRTGRRISDPFASPTKPAANFGKDFAVRSGLLYLATHIGHPNFPTAKQRDRVAGAAPEYYFFWSLERVGMIYGLKTIGKKDWYAWGSQILLEHQSDNGSWQGKYGETIDTCFALLFLQRANVARDLTAALSGKVQDPGDIKLRAGGVGGEALLAQGAKSGETKESPSAEQKPAKPEPPAPAPRKERESAKRGAQSPEPSSTPRSPAPAAESTEEKAAAELAKQLVEAPSDKQETMIDSLKEHKGVAYTDALAMAIPQLKGPSKLRARDALAERLTRMTASTLREKLQDESAEVRRAAALACAMKEDKGLIGDLINLLADPQPPVSLAAHVALKELTQKDFGPDATASPRERASALAKWKEWWKRQERK